MEVEGGCMRNEESKVRAWLELCHCGTADVSYEYLCMLYSTSDTRIKFTRVPVCLVPVS